MLTTDLPVICVIESALVLFALYAAIRDARIRKNEKGSGISAEVVRGDKSMAALYTVYGATIASLLVLINNASGVEGNKVVLIVLNFMCVTYAFFFSSTLSDLSD
jgi:membrane protein insertase Oxa1/YidC/SpoIIIJ